MDMDSKAVLSHSKPFSQLTSSEKMKRVTKMVVCLFTFGFAFPNIFIE